MREPQNGDLLFYSGTSAWSRLIRLRTWSMWSHVGIVLRTSCAGMAVVESIEGTGVRVVPVSVWNQWPGDMGWASVPAGHEQRERIVDFALNRLGCEYASAVQFVRSFSWAWRWAAANVFRLSLDVNPERYFCSELAAAAIQHAGITLEANPARISPGDLAEQFGVRPYV